MCTNLLGLQNDSLFQNRPYKFNRLNFDYVMGLSSDFLFDEIDGTEGLGDLCLDGDNDLETE